MSAAVFFLLDSVFFSHGQNENLLPALKDPGASRAGRLVDFYVRIDSRWKLSHLCVYHTLGGDHSALWSDVWKGDVGTKARVIESRPCVSLNFI